MIYNIITYISIIGKVPFEQTVEPIIYEARLKINLKKAKKTQKRVFAIKNP